MRFTSFLFASTLLTLAACNGDEDSDTMEGTDGDSGMMEVDYNFRTDAPSAYTRVDRIGMPAVATALIASKDAYNAADPVDDVALDFAGEILASLGVLHGALDDDLEGAGLVPCTVVGDATGSCATQGVPLIIPDTLVIDFTAASGFPNGRELADPVIDVTLAVVLIDLGTDGQDAGTLAGLPLNPPANDVDFMTAFPYLAAAN